MVARFADTTCIADRVRSLLEHYDVRVHRFDMRPVTIDIADKLRDVQANLETCIEELAIRFGVNWFRIGGLTLPHR